MKSIAFDKYNNIRYESKCELQKFDKKSLGNRYESNSIRQEANTSRYEIHLTRHHEETAMKSIACDKSSVACDTKSNKNIENR